MRKYKHYIYLYIYIFIYIYIYRFGVHACLLHGGTVAALITCDETEAFLGERNAFLRCEIIAKPKPGAIFWIINSNGTTVAEGDIVDGYWTLLMVYAAQIIRWASQYGRPLRS